MGFLDFFLNRDKQALKKRKEEMKQEINGIPQENFERDQKLIDIAEKFTLTKNKIIKLGLILDTEFDKEQSPVLINDFFYEFLEKIPQGTICAIETDFEIKGKKQAIILGKGLISSSKFLKKNGTKPKQGILKHDYLALMINTKESLKNNINDQNYKGKNIYIKVDENSSIVNLISEEFLTNPTKSCRLSNLEFIFEDWTNSLSFIKDINDIDNTEKLLRYMPELDFLITDQMTSLLENEVIKMEEIINDNEKSKNENKEEIEDSDNNYD